MAQRRQAGRSSLALPGFRELRPGEATYSKSARRYLNLATGEAVSRRQAQGLTARGYGAGKVVKTWRTINYKTLRGVMGRLQRLPSGIVAFVVAHGQLLHDSGNDLAGTMAWKLVLPVTRSETLRTFTSGEVLLEAHSIFVAGTIDKWSVRWR